MERRFHSPQTFNPGADPRIVRRTRSRSSNNSSPAAVDPGSDPLAGVGSRQSRNSIESGETFDKEVLTDDDDEEEVVPNLHSSAAANSLSEPSADVRRQNSITSMSVGGPLSDTPIANSISEPPADVSRSRSQNSSVPVGDSLSGTPNKTLDGQGYSGGERMVEAGKTFDAEAQDDEEVGEGEVVGEVSDLNNAASRRHSSGSGVAKQNRATCPSGNETRSKTFIHTRKSPSEEVGEELESQQVSPTGEEQPDSDRMEGLLDSAEFFAGLQGGPATTS